MLGPVIQKLIGEIVLFLCLENMVIYCHWTYQRAKSLSQQQKRTFSMEKVVNS